MAAVARALDVSRTMLYDIKNMHVPVSEKMWRKLELAEAEIAERSQTKTATTPLSLDRLLERVRAEFYLPTDSDFEGKNPKEIHAILQAMADAMAEMEQRRSAFTNRLISAAGSGLSVKVLGRDSFTKGGVPITDAEQADARAKLDELKRRASQVANQPAPEDRRKRA